MEGRVLSRVRLPRRDGRTFRGRGETVPLLLRLLLPLAVPADPMPLLREHGPGDALLLHRGGRPHPGRCVPQMQPVPEDARRAPRERGRAAGSRRPRHPPPGPAGREGRVREGEMSRLPGDDAKGGDAPPVLRYDGRRLAPAHHLPVREVPVALTVNGVARATPLTVRATGTSRTGRCWAGASRRPSYRRTGGASPPFA